MYAIRMLQIVFLPLYAYFGINNNEKVYRHILNEVIEPAPLKPLSRPHNYALLKYSIESRAHQP